MKTYSANIMHNGKLFHQFTKHEPTTPHVIMLMAVHGKTAVTDIVETGFDAGLDLAQEREKLIRIYGIKKFEEMFPGFAPHLPSDLAQVGIAYKTAKDVDKAGPSPLVGSLSISDARADG